MILSNTEIQKALDSGRLIIQPRPTPARPVEGGAHCPYNTTAVDLRLGDEVSVPISGRAFKVDLAAGNFASLYNPSNYRRAQLSDDQPYSLGPGKFVLAQTLEKIELPIVKGKRPLAARVEGRSSFARCGMLVHFTAPTIHAGFRGHITLEITNLGLTAISLTPGTHVCQLIFEEVAGVPFRNDSQFHDQDRPGGRQPRKTKRG